MRFKVGDIVKDRNSERRFKIDCVSSFTRNDELLGYYATEITTKEQLFLYDEYLELSTNTETFLREIKDE